MPTYAYACKECGHAFDIQQAFSDESLSVCPVCSGVLRKKFNSVGVVFKGSGFYRNDSRDTRSSVDAGAKPASTESKPAAGSAAKAPAAPAPQAKASAAAPAATGKAAS
jgi:putative FmdB family regulatory protein